MLSEKNDFIGMEYLGRLTARSTDEIEESNWFLGCETLDRDYADYDQYKEYLCPLGIKSLRFQGGWAKTEKKRGVYDWEWLDHIIDDAVGRGLRPWLQTGYGNSIYPGAGGENLGAGMPLSEEGFAAYLRWVEGMVSRYADRVWDWEVWNEPNFADNKINTPEITAEFNIRTAKVIKRIQPQARISALAMGHINLSYAEQFLKYLAEHNACGLFHNLTYHDYVYNPDGNKLAVYRLRQLTEKYAPNLILRQGENGAPSERGAGGALADYDWSEAAQAKWDVRRMLENLGNDIQSSVYSIADLQYTGNGPIRRKNSKGLLETNADNVVLRPKLAYYAVQNVAAVFDSRLERLRNTAIRHTLTEEDTDGCWIGTDRSVAIYGYRSKRTGGRLYAVWRDDAIPADEDRVDDWDIRFAGSRFKNPVLIDIITGRVYRIPEGKWRREGGIDCFKQMPVYDAPILIAESDIVAYQA